MVFDWEQFATTFVGEGAVDASLVALVRLKRSCSQNHAGVRRTPATKPARQMHQLAPRSARVLGQMPGAFRRKLARAMLAFGEKFRF